MVHTYFKLRYKKCIAISKSGTKKCIAPACFWKRHLEDLTVARLESVWNHKHVQQSSCVACQELLYFPKGTKHKYTHFLNKQSAIKFQHTWQAKIRAKMLSYLILLSQYKVQWKPKRLLGISTKATTKPAVAIETQHVTSIQQGNMSVNHSMRKFKRPITTQNINKHLRIKFMVTSSDHDLYGQAMTMITLDDHDI